MSDQNAPIPLLPVWATVENTYKAVWFYRREYLKIAWPWLLLAVGAACLLSWFKWSVMGNEFCFDLAHLADIKAPKKTNPALHIINLIDILFPIFLGAPVAVVWHRLILRREKAVPRRFDGVVRDYFYFAIFILALSAVPALLLVLSPYPRVGLSFLAIILISMLSLRFSVILPARALEIKNVTLKMALRRTSWNFWRLFWGSVLCALPGTCLSIFFVKANCTSLIPFMTSGIGSMLGFFVLLPFELTFLSLCYQHFFEREQQSLPQNSGFPVRTIAFSLIAFIVCSVAYNGQNAVQKLGSDIQKETAQCNNATDLNARLEACTKLINLGIADAAIYTKRAAVKAEKNNNINEALDDLNQALKIKSDYFPALFLRSQIYFPKGQYSETIQDIDQALPSLGTIKISPDKISQIASDLHFNRGIAKLYTVSPAAAIDDLAEALKTEPTNAYKVLLLYIARNRAGQNDDLEFAANSARLPADKWPMPVIALYQEKASVEEVYAKAKTGDEKTQREQTCEADFYIGELYLQKNMKDNAIAAFQAAHKECPEEFLEAMLVRTELKNLGLEPASQLPKP